MNEEINVKFGGDLTPLGNSLRTMNKMVHDAGEEAKKTLKSSFESLGSIISGGAILAGMKGVIDKFDEIDKRAKNLSISTDFLQGMEQIARNESAGGAEGFNKAIAQLSVNLGEAKNGVTETITKFQRWGITLKDISELNTEQMFYKLADVIKAIPDPAQRSAAAFDLLGKAGKDMAGIMAGGSEDVKKMVDAVDKLDSQKIKDLADAKKTIENVGNTATVWLGKTLGAVGRLGTIAGYASMGTTTGMEDAFSRANTPSGATGGGSIMSSTALAAQAAALQKAKDEYLHAKAMEGDDLTKLVRLVGEKHDLEQRIAAIAGETAEKYKLMTEQAQKQNEVNELQAKIDKDRADRQTKSDDDHKKKLEEERQLNDEIHKTRDMIARTTREEAAERRAPYLPTLEELAGSGRAFFGGNHWQIQQGPFAGMARELLRLQSDARQSLIWGNQDRFNQDTSRIDELKKALVSAGVMAPQDQMATLNEKMTENNNHLAELNQKAKTDGIVVRGQD